MQGSAVSRFSEHRRGEENYTHPASAAVRSPDSCRSPAKSATALYAANRRQSSVKFLKERNGKREGNTHELAIHPEPVIFSCQ